MIILKIYAAVKIITRRHGNKEISLLKRNKLHILITMTDRNNTLISPLAAGLKAEYEEIVPKISQVKRYHAAILFLRKAKRTME